MADEDILAEEDLLTYHSNLAKRLVLINLRHSYSEPLIHLGNEILIPSSLFFAWFVVPRALWRDFKKVVHVNDDDEPLVPRVSRKESSISGDFNAYVLEYAYFTNEFSFRKRLNVFDDFLQNLPTLTIQMSALEGRPRVSFTMTTESAEEVETLQDQKGTPKSHLQRWKAPMDRKDYVALDLEKSWDTQLSQVLLSAYTKWNDEDMTQIVWPDQNNDNPREFLSALRAFAVHVLSHIQGFLVAIRALLRECKQVRSKWQTVPSEWVQKRRRIHIIQDALLLALENGKTVPLSRLAMVPDDSISGVELTLFNVLPSSSTSVTSSSSTAPSSSFVKAKPSYSELFLIGEISNQFEASQVPHDSRKTHRQRREEGKGKEEGEQKATQDLHVFRNKNKTFITSTPFQEAIKQHRNILNSLPLISLHAFRSYQKLALQGSLAQEAVIFPQGGRVGLWYFLFYYMSYRAAVYFLHPSQPPFPFVHELMELILIFPIQEQMEITADDVEEVIDLFSHL